MVFHIKKIFSGKQLLLCFITGIMLLIGNNTLYGQKSEIDVNEEYNNALLLFNKGKYNIAMQSFKKVAGVDKNNPYKRYAGFYYGLSALKSGSLYEAKSMFLQLKDRHSNWEQLKWVDYWLAESYWQMQEHRKAIDLIQTRLNDNLSKEAQSAFKSMQQYYLHQMNIETLSSIQKAFPENKAISEVLVKRLAAQPYSKSSDIVIDSLARVFNIETRDYGMINKRSSNKKDQYTIGIMLPFMLEGKNLDRLSERDDHFVFDLYRGLKLARQDLKQEGINIKLLPFDSRKYSIWTKKLIKIGNLDACDLIIGPLYPQTLPVVTRYARNQKTYMFNPLSSNPEIIRNNPFSFLIKSSYVTQAQVAARFAKDSLNCRDAMVIYGKGVQDSIMAHSYKEAFQQDTTYKVSVFRKIDLDSASKIPKLIGKRDTTVQSHIFTASDDEILAAGVMSGVIQWSDSADIKVIGHENWINHRSVSLDQLENTNAYLLAPDYLKTDNPALRTFKDRYQSQYFKFPTHYVYRAYDMMIFLGNMLHKHGTYFHEFIEEPDLYPGKLYEGYDFYNAWDNQYVPIINLNDSQLDVVNKRTPKNKN